jgi:hypothetical protein
VPGQVLQADAIKCVTLSLALTSPFIHSPNLMLPRTLAKQSKALTSATIVAMFK